MTNLETILAILKGTKVKVGSQWKVYDPNGVEIVDTGGVLWKGVHGVLLMWPRAGAPSRAHKEEKHRRDVKIDWRTTINDQILQKKQEVKEVQKQIKIVKSTRSKVSPDNFKYFDRELSELLVVLEGLMNELNALEETKVEFNSLPRSLKKNIEEEADDFEDILFILKFVLKRI